ncbi:MAG: dockerin type I repeat-containing protein [Oscillospiraceae bacterium]|nr:dockerin type I repeat-containing protein [Oscillospiraceae bacterium]
MKKLNVLKSAVSALIASVMLGTAMLPAAASDITDTAPDMTTFMKSGQIFYLDELDNRYYLTFGVKAEEFLAIQDEILNSPDYDPFTEGINDVWKQAVKNLKTYRFEDSVQTAVFRFVSAWAMGYYTDEERDSYIQTVAEGGTLPEDVVHRVLSEEYVLDLAHFGSPDGDKNYPHSWEEFAEVLPATQKQYGRDGILFATVVYEKEDSTVNVSYNDAGLSNEVCSSLLTYVLSGSGDINGNSEADLTDAVLLARAIGGTYELSAASRREADLNGDLNVDQNDLNALLRVLAGA